AARIAAQIDQLPTQSDATDWSPCAGAGESRVEACNNWIEASQHWGAEAQRRFHLIATSIAAGDNERAEAQCQSLYEYLSGLVDVLSGDRGVAVAALDAGLLCPGRAWSHIALPLIGTDGGGGYEYLRELATVLAVRNDAGAASDFASRLATKAGGNA